MQYAKREGRPQWFTCFRRTKLWSSKTKDFGRCHHSSLFSLYFLVPITRNGAFVQNSASSRPCLYSFEYLFRSLLGETYLDVLDHDAFNALSQKRKKNALVATPATKFTAISDVWTFCWLCIFVLSLWEIVSILFIFNRDEIKDCKNEMLNY